MFYREMHAGGHPQSSPRVSIITRRNNNALRRALLINSSLSLFVMSLRVRALVFHAKTNSHNGERRERRHIKQRKSTHTEESQPTSFFKLLGTSSLLLMSKIKQDKGR
jgi:hypothetical protein